MAGVSLLRFLVCLVVGHDDSPWAEIIEIHESTNGTNGPFLTTSRPSQGRYCRRCDWHYQQRVSW